jgi:hypothetical protein
MDNVVYCIEYDTKTEDDEKEITISRTENFSSITSMAKWARALPPRFRIARKYKINEEKFSFLDEREFEITRSLRP